MRIVTRKALDSRTEEQIRELAAVCKQHDGLTSDKYLDTSMNFNQEMDSIFLMYDGDSLVSELTLFMPSPHEAEVYANTRPECRRKGYFKALLENAVSELRSYRVPELLFVCEGTSADGRAAVKKLGASYEFSEYSMGFDAGHAHVVSDYRFRVQLVQAHWEDLDKLADMAAVINGMDRDTSHTIMRNTLQSDNRRAYAVEKDGEWIGMANTSVEDRVVSIYTLGVMPEYQGQGYGRETLFLIVRELLDSGETDITLEVDSGNARALQLYRKSGFQVRTQLDYYRKTIAQA